MLGRPLALKLQEDRDHHLGSAQYHLEQLLLLEVESRGGSLNYAKAPSFVDDLMCKVESKIKGAGKSLCLPRSRPVGRPTGLRPWALRSARGCSR